jgi:hypothetical protein
MLVSIHDVCLWSRDGWTWNGRADGRNTSDEDAEMAIGAAYGDEEDIFGNTRA